MSFILNLCKRSKFSLGTCDINILWGKSDFNSIPFMFYQWVKPRPFFGKYSAVFSSPEPNVSFSDHLLSVRLSVRSSVCKLFTFSISSLEPVGQFQLNLAQSTPRQRGFKVVKNKDHTHLKGQIIRNLCGSTLR